MTAPESPGGSAGRGRGDAVPADDLEARRELARPRDTRFARLYGARAWHLLVLLALLAGTAYVVSRLLDAPALFRIALWFVGAAVVWDLVLGPLLTLADTGLRAVLGRAGVSGVRPLNYLRAPLLVSALLLLMFTPLIFQRSEQVYRGKTGLTQDPYLDRWLAVTALLLAVSAAAFVLAVVRARRRGHPTG